MERVARTLQFGETEDAFDGDASPGGVRLHVLQPGKQHSSETKFSKQRGRGTKRRLESQEAYPPEDKTVFMAGEKVKTAAILAGALLGDRDVKVPDWEDHDKENCVALAQKVSINGDLQQVACMGNTKVFLKESQVCIVFSFLWRRGKYMLY